MPKFGFGSETRKDVALERSKLFPGPGNYAITPLIGNEGTKKTMHSTIKYSPETKEQSYKPGPGNYEPNPLNVKKKEPQYKMGSSTRLDLGFQKRSQY